MSNLALGSPRDRESPSLIEAVALALGRSVGRLAECTRTLVQACVVEGKPTLFFERGLPVRRPVLFRYLVRFAKDNRLELKEDRRRGARPVSRNRRRRWGAMTALAAGLLSADAATAETMVEPAAPGRAASVDLHESARLARFGARAVAPWSGATALAATSGEPTAADLVDVALAARRFGEAETVRVEGLAGADATGALDVPRYDYRCPSLNHDHRFSYFDGPGFHALGHRSEGQVELDVLVGGGTYAAPRLWSNLDNVMGDSVEFQLLRGDGIGGGFGIARATYTVTRSSDPAPGFADADPNVDLDAPVPVSGAGGTTRS